MPKVGVPDPCPSKTHPEHRATRKELEKKNDGLEWMTGIILALSGLVVAFNIEKDVNKCEEKKQKRERSNSGSRDGRDRRDRGESYPRRDRDRQRSRGSERDQDRYRDDDRYRGYDRHREQDRYLNRTRDTNDWARDRRRQERLPRDYYDNSRRDYNEDRRGYQPWDDRDHPRRSGGYSSW